MKNFIQIIIILCTVARYMQAHILPTFDRQLCHKEKIITAAIITEVIAYRQHATQTEKHRFHHE